MDTVVRQGCDIDLVLVVRGGPAPALNVHPGALRLHVVHGPRIISLSRARNAALDFARRSGLLDRADIVAFPDDDCQYPDGTLERVEQLMASPVGVVCGSYAPGWDRLDLRRFPLRDRPLSPAHAMAASSNTMFFAARAVAVVGDFDERLGLGARYASSEDVDYILRALRGGFVGVYRPSAAFVVHPYKRHHAAAYYVGVVAALSKHAFGGGTLPLLIRRIGLGTGLLLSGRLPLREYLRALRASGYWLRRSPDPTRA